MDLCGWVRTGVCLFGIAYEHRYLALQGYGGGCKLSQNLADGMTMHLDERLFWQGMDLQKEFFALTLQFTKSNLKH
jgi:hypothetical protein